VSQNLTAATCNGRHLDSGACDSQRLRSGFWSKSPNGSLFCPWRKDLGSASTYLVQAFLMDLCFSNLVCQRFSAVSPSCPICPVESAASTIALTWHAAGSDPAPQAVNGLVDARRGGSY
jgi:hypothetical protein